jgi:methylmalonyl-CoA mutase C-terminal domain/subunit
MAIFPKIVELLKKEQRDDILLFAGGIIPDDDVPVLKRMGFRGIFGPGADTRDIVRFIREEVSQRVNA